MGGIFNGIFWVIIWIVFIIFTVGVGIIPFAVYLFLMFGGEQKREAKAMEKLKSTLMVDENILTASIQNRIFGLWHRRHVLAITNSRVITVKRGILGGFKMQDIQWKDLRDARLNQNVLSSICGSNVFFGHFKNDVGSLELKGIPDKEASEMYSKSQSEEQAWEEKRRVREIEEVRAASGGTVIHTGQDSHQASSGQSTSGNNITQQITEAKKLLDDGTISDAEFQEMKAKIIS